MGGNPPGYFFFPLGRKVRLCAQSSKNPFRCGSCLGPPFGPPRRTLFSLEVGDRWMK
jgi:hypothetical protein